MANHEKLRKCFGVAEDRFSGFAVQETLAAFAMLNRLARITAEIKKRVLIVIGIFASLVTLISMLLIVI